MPQEKEISHCTCDKKFRPAQRHVAHDTIGHDDVYDSDSGDELDNEPGNSDENPIDRYIRKTEQKIRVNEMAIANKLAIARHQSCKMKLEAELPYPVATAHNRTCMFNSVVTFLCSFCVSYPSS